MLLALDTSTTAIGAAVHDGRAVLSRVVHLQGRGHAELLAPAISEALAEAGIRPRDLERVVCGVGPGPFTGLRVGIGTALVMAHALDLEAPSGICSLDVLAHAARDRVEGDLLVATDARRKEVYWARYTVSGAGAVRREGPAVDRAADLPEEVRALPVAGRGALLYPEALPTALPDGPLDVDPGVLAELAIGLSAGEHPAGGSGILPPEPLYLRRPDAQPAPATGAGAR